LTPIQNSPPRRDLLAGLASRRAVAVAAVCGVTLLIAIVATVVLDRGPSPLAASGFARTTDQAAADLDAAIPGLKVIWSPLVHHDSVGSYRAVRVGGSEFRVYLSTGKAVTAVGVTETAPKDPASAEREAERFVQAAAPKISAGRRAYVATVLAGLVNEGAKGAVRMAGVEFDATPGPGAYSLLARPD
jgi:hypothetical protein